MARWQVPFKRKALRPIPRVVDNTEAMAIKQGNLDRSRTPIRKGAKRGVFNPRGNTNFR